MIQDVGNDQVFQIFIGAYLLKSQGYETLWDGSADHVEYARI